jgi:uncharacterized membrane protein YbhN (UPF0104 family)
LEPERATSSLPTVAPPRPSRLRTVLPLAGTVVLVALFAATTDTAKSLAALRQADALEVAVALAISVVAAWVYDSFCLTWLVRATLRDRGRPDPLGLRDLAPVKAASYVLNIVSYHAATLGIAWVIARRKGVSFLEAAGALAAMSWLDLVAVTAMAVIGLQVAPDVVAGTPGLQGFLRMIALVVFAVALASVLVLQSGLPWEPLKRLRNVAVLRPLAALGPKQMVTGLVLRFGMVMVYLLSTMWVQHAFGMNPTLGRMLVAQPIVTVVGTVPVSVSGLGTTQVLMRTLYAPFVQDGRAAAPVIDACSTVTILGAIALRLALAAPFLRGVLAEIRERREG